MKKQTILAVAAAMLTACAQNDIQELPSTGSSHLYVTTEQPETRIQLDDACRTVWTAGDEVSVFNYSTANERWRFDGQTGDTEGTLSKTEGGNGNALNGLYAFYPYDKKIYHTGSVIITSLPPLQEYRAGSYGTGSNPMIAKGNNDKLRFENLCGWIRVQLVGAGNVKRIELQGNSDEALAGSAQIDPVKGTLSCIGLSASRLLTLDCGDGVALSTAATSFYFTVPPQTFVKGITVTAFCAHGTEMKLSTQRPIKVVRNHIIPMSTSEYAGSASDHAILYTTSDDKILEPFAKNVFGANLLSNTYENGQGILLFDGPVTQIGKSAFFEKRMLTSIIIPASVTAIGDMAFRGCEELKGQLNLPENLTSLGIDAFADCISITDDLIIPPGIQTIPFRAFYNCFRLDGKLVLPEGLTTIDDLAFAYCKNLTGRLKIPKTVTSIGKSAFRNCTAFIGDLVIPSSVKTVGDYAFQNSSFTGHLRLSENMTEIATGTFSNCRGLWGELEIPTKIVSIGSNAFDKCTGFTGDLTIPQNVRSIGVAAFMNCIGLNGRLTISEGVITLADYAFRYTGFTGKLVLPETITSIGSMVFQETKIEEVVLPGSCNEWGEGCFNICSHLTKVILPENMLVIPDLSNCENLTDVQIPESVTTIESYTFQNTGIQHIRLSKNIRKIGKMAFGQCRYLQTVEFDPEIKLTTIENSTFCETPIETITIPRSVEVIGVFAFSGCDKLKSIRFDAGSALKRLDDGGSSRYGAGGAFSDCTALTDIILPQSLTYIGAGTFNNCTSLQSIALPESVRNIGADAFYQCAALQTITIPKEVTRIGSRAFLGCISLRSFYSDSPEFETTADKRCLVSSDGILYAFAPAGAPLAYTIPSTTPSFTIRNIGPQVFRDQEITNKTFCKLTSIALPATITGIGQYAFYNKLIEEVHLKTNVPPSLTWTSSVIDSSIGGWMVGNSSDPFPRSVMIYVPETSAELYRSSWTNRQDQIVGYN